MSSEAFDSIYNSDKFFQSTPSIQPEPQDYKESQAGKQAKDRYMPNSADLRDFEGASKLFQQNYSKEDLTAMANADNPAVQKMSNYLLQNFETVADLTSGGKQNTIGIGDIRMLVDASQAASDVQDLQKTIPETLKSFDQLKGEGFSLLPKEVLTDKKFAALNRNFDMVKGITDDKRWLDYGLSKSDLEHFEGKVALNSLLSEAHNRRELNERTFYPRLIARGIAAAVVAADLLSGSNDKMTATQQKQFFDATEQLTISGCSWWYRDKTNDHYKNKARPALDKLLQL